VVREAVRCVQEDGSVPFGGAMTGHGGAVRSLLRCCKQEQPSRISVAAML
jgi:hypothetical protein